MLWKTTAKYIKKYTDSLGLTGDDRLFKNKNGDILTHSSIRSRIEKLITLAFSKVPTLSGTNITAHTYHHSVAMNLLQSGFDISTIAIWLGHSNIEMAHKYMVADIDLKCATLEKVGTSGNKRYPRIFEFSVELFMCCCHAEKLRFTLHLASSGT